MSHTRNHARPLLTDAEYGLFTASVADEIVEIDAAGLRRAIGRTGALRNNSHDTTSSSVEVRKRAGGRGAALAANERTAKMEVALSETLGRFEMRLVQMQTSESRRGRAKGRVSRPTVACLGLPSAKR